MRRRPRSRRTGFPAGAYTRPFLSSTLAVLVTPPRVPLSNKLGENHAPNVSHKMSLHRAEKWTSVSPWFPAEFLRKAAIPDGAALTGPEGEALTM